VVVLDVAQTKRGVVEVVSNAMATRNLHFFGYGFGGERGASFFICIQGCVWRNREGLVN